MPHLKTSSIVNHVVATNLGSCVSCKDAINLLSGEYSECFTCAGIMCKKCDRCACDQSEEIEIVSVEGFPIGNIVRGGEYTWN